jgi:hypothetical protein
MTTLITPVVGATYNFIFVSGYDALNGIYQLVQIMSYDEYLENEGDIDKDFFTPNNKSDELATEIVNVRDSKILKLVDPDGDDDAEPVYAPLYYLKETPDFNVHKYQQLGIIANIGFAYSAEDVEFIKNTISDTVVAATGITPDPKLVVIKEQWMTEDQYNELLEERDETKKKVLNYYSENLQLEKRLAAVNTKLKAYEELIINLQQQVDRLKTSAGD